jgi:hypothetical protein
MTNSKHFPTTAQQQRYQLRFLALCLEAIRQSGQCSYPPLLELYETAEASTTSDSHPQETEATASGLRLHGINVDDLKYQAKTSHELIIHAAQFLQNLETWNCSPQIQEVIQIIVEETKVLEVLLQPLSPPDSEWASALKRLSYLRDYLLQKLSDTHFLSPQGLRAEQPMIFLQQHRRVYKYLSQLQAVTNSLIEMLCHQIETSQNN